MFLNMRPLENTDTKYRKICFVLIRGIEGEIYAYFTDNIKNPAGAGFEHRQAISPAAETEPAEEPG